MANGTILNNNITSTLTEDTYGQYKASILIWKIVPPILLVLGTIGNCLSILVLSRRTMKTSTTALCLNVLAFSDLIVLYTGLLRQWLIYFFDKDVRNISVAGCKINNWLVYSSLDYSAWILIVVTVERITSVLFPHSSKRVWTKTFAIVSMSLIGIFILGLNAHFLYGMTFETYYDSSGRTVTVNNCVEINSNYYDFAYIVWPWIDLCTFCIIPFCVIVIGNSLILFKVIQSQKRANLRIVPSENKDRNTAPKTRSKNSSMTAMLLTINIVFLITSLPISIYDIGYAYWIANADAKKLSELDLWWAIVNMLMYMNNSLNFLLYCLSGTKFRREVINIFCSFGNQVTKHVALTKRLCPLELSSTLLDIQKQKTSKCSHQVELM